MALRLLFVTLLRTTQPYPQAFPRTTCGESICLRPSPTLLPGSLCRGERRHLDDLVTVSGRTQDAWCWLWVRLECRTHPLAGHLEHTQTPLERKGTLQCLGTSEVRVLLPQFQFGWRCSLGKTFCPPDSSSGGDDLVRPPWHRWGVTQYDPYPGSPVQNKHG